MKRTIGSIIAGILLLTVTRTQAQTNTNTAAAKVDFLTLHLQLSLSFMTNASDAGDVAETGNARLNTKDIIQLLSGGLAFVLQDFTNGDGVVSPQPGAGVHPTYSPKAKLLIMQPLGTNHGDAYIVVRDGGTNYIVNGYFNFTTTGFGDLTNQVVRGSANLNNPDYTAYYILHVTFTTQPEGFNNGNELVGFDVSGKAKERRGPVSVKGNEIDPDSIKNLQAPVVGTGSLTGNFSIVDGMITAGSPVKESR